MSEQARVGLPASLRIEIVVVDVASSLRTLTIASRAICSGNASSAQRFACRRYAGVNILPPAACHPALSGASTGPPHCHCRLSYYNRALVPAPCTCASAGSGRGSCIPVRTIVQWHAHVGAGGLQLPPGLDRCAGA